MRRLLRGACALALVLLGLGGATPAAADTIQVRVVAEDGVPTSSFLSDVGSVIGRLHAYYEDTLGLDFGGDIALNVTVIDDRETYLARAATVNMPNAGRTYGFYSRKTGGVVWRGADRALAQSVLVHEISHDLLARAGRRVPPWLNEGLAEVAQSYQIDGNAIWLVPDPGVLERLRRGVNGWRPTARLVLTSTPAVWAELGSVAGVRPDYDHGSMLVAFLLSSASGIETMRALLAGSGEGLSPEGAVQIAEATYPGGVARLETDWASWWSGRPGPLQLPIRTGSADLAAPPACQGVLIRRGGVDECVR